MRKVNSFLVARFVFHKMAKTKKSKKVEECVITLTLGDTTIQGTGTTVLEALQSLPVPVKVVTKGVITVAHEGKNMQAVLTVPRIKRLFFPLAQNLLAKQLNYLLR